MSAIEHTIPIIPVADPRLAPGADFAPPAMSRG